MEFTVSGVGLRHDLILCFSFCLSYASFPQHEANLGGPVTRTQKMRLDKKCHHKAFLFLFLFF